ncbi:peptide chain release factor 1 [Acidobacteria bacterium AH-259-A15]|nr:peptide chain release factor 1 [Acidobacteria bacterium AH-259-A15]
MFEKLNALEEKYEELSRLLADAKLIVAREKYRKTAQAHAELQEIVSRYRNYKSISKEIEGTKKILEEEEEEELLALARTELQELGERKAGYEEELKLLLLPEDPNDEKNVILEIRAGAGGNEATLFAQEIFRMYTRYGESRDWNTQVLSAHLSSVGGFKEIIAMIEGEDVYRRLKYESGVHRVQRVPETETQGRLHTSAVTVAVLPEADEVEVQIDPKDLRIDTYCSSGPGGQSVNTTYSAVRITHVPTGEVVTCQDEKSQIKNKAKAMRVLRSRLYEKAHQQQQSELAQTRRAMVGSGDRSEKIRTYNFPQNRVTDHRLGLNLHQLNTVMEGDLDTIIDALITSSRTEALKNQKIA